MVLITLFKLITTPFALALADEATVKQLVSQIAPKYGISEQLVIAIVKVESNFNPNAIGSSHKERGLMQLHPKWFPEASLDPAKNIEMGIKYLAKLKRLCYPKYGRAWFICYNLGPNKLVKYPELFDYYKKVINAKKALKGETDRVRIASDIR